MANNQQILMFVRFWFWYFFFVCCHIQFYYNTNMVWQSDVCWWFVGKLLLIEHGKRVYYVVFHKFWILSPRKDWKKKNRQTRIYLLISAVFHGRKFGFYFLNQKEQTNRLWKMFCNWNFVMERFTSSFWYVKRSDSDSYESYTICNFYVLWGFYSLFLVYLLLNYQTWVKFRIDINYWLHNNQLMCNIWKEKTDSVISLNYDIVDLQKSFDTPLFSSLHPMYTKLMMVEKYTFQWKKNKKSKLTHFCSLVS